MATNYTFAPINFARDETDSPTMADTKRFDINFTGSDSSRLETNMKNLVLNFEAWQAEKSVHAKHNRQFFVEILSTQKRSTLDD